MPMPNQGFWPRFLKGGTTMPPAALPCRSADPSNLSTSPLGWLGIAETDVTWQDLTARPCQIRTAVPILKSPINSSIRYWFKCWVFLHVSRRFMGSEAVLIRPIWSLKIEWKHNRSNPSIPCLFMVRFLVLEHVFWSFCKLWADVSLCLM